MADSAIALGGGGGTGSGFIEVVALPGANSVDVVQGGIYLRTSDESIWRHIPGQDAMTSPVVVSSYAAADFDGFPRYRGEFNTGFPIAGASNVLDYFFRSHPLSSQFLFAATTIDPGSGDELITGGWEVLVNIMSRGRDLSSYIPVDHVWIGGDGGGVDLQFADATAANAYVVANGFDLTKTLMYYDTTDTRINTLVYITTGGVVTPATLPVWAQVNPAGAGIAGATGNTGARGTSGIAVAVAFRESATVPTAPTVTQDASNALTFTDLWSLDYPVTPTNPVYSAVITYPYDGMARTIAATSVEGPFKATGADGADGAVGTPGGGALELVGNYGETIVAATDDIWRDMGFDWPVDSKWCAYTVQNRAYWFDGDMLYGDNAVDAALVGAASATATRMQIPEPVAGAAYFGRTAANRALVEWASTIGAVTVSIYRYIPGPTGGGGGGGTSEARVQQLINATSLSALQGMVADAQIPAAIMRDAEFTASAILTLLGLTAAQIDDLFIGAVIVGQIITVTQADGSTFTLTIPQGAGGMADGVVSSGAFNAAGTELTLTLSDASTVVIDVPAVLRSGTGVALAWEDEGTALGAVSTVNVVGAGATAVLDAGVLTVNIPGGTHGPDHALWFGWSADQNPIDSEFLVSSDTHTVIVPTATGFLYAIIWRSDADGGDPNEVHFAGGNNIRNTFGVPTAYELDGVAGQVIVSVNTQNADVWSGEEVRVA